MEGEHSKEEEGPRTRLFAVLSGVYLLIVVNGAALLGYFDPSGTPIEPNEWGDVLAGVFSPLAFLWLIYASLSQRAELAMQRAELKTNNETQDAQRQEMQRQGEAMLAQATLLEAQATAAFDPLFAIAILYPPSALNNNTYRMELKNYGADVSNLTVHGFGKLARISDGSGIDIGQGLVYVWLKETSVTLLAPANSENNQTLRLRYTRKDGATRESEYRIVLARSSLILAHTVTVER